MDRWHNHYLDQCAHFITSTVQDWQPCLLEHAEVVYRHWRESAARNRCRLVAYVIMPDHVHLVVWAQRGSDVQAFTQRWLSTAAREVGDGGRFWKERPRVLAIWTRKVLEVKVDYIHRNPIRRGLVVNAEDWAHSSYRQLELGAEAVPLVCSGLDVLPEPSE